MDLLVESVLAIDEENVETSSTEQACTLKSGKSGADDSHVVARSHETYPPGALFSKAGSPKKGRDRSAPGSGILRLAQDSRQVLCAAKRVLSRHAPARRKNEKRQMTNE